MMTNKKKQASHGIPDAAFERGKTPMTKAEVRAVTLAKLQLKKNDVLVDIGAGTGSITIEAACLLTEGKVIAVERSPAAIELVRRNQKKFGCENIEIMNLEAPEGLNDLKGITKIMIGGSGGHLAELVAWAVQVLPPNGRLVLNMITVENIHAGWQALQKFGFEDLEMVQLAVSKGKPVGKVTMMMGQNPVTILSARKGEEK